MQQIQYKQIEEVDFELEIPSDLFQKIIQEGDDKAYKLLNSDDDIIFVYNKILKWLFIESTIDTKRLKYAYETGYEEGYFDIQKSYADKYVIGSDQIQTNLKEIYRRFRLVRETNYHKFNSLSLILYGESAGVTRRIEELAFTYPYDFQDFLTTYKDVLLIDKIIILQFYEEYKKYIPMGKQPESYEKFFKRFLLNSKEGRLIEKGEKAGDEFSQMREWQLNMLLRLKEMAKGKYKNFDDYTFNAFGIKYSKIGKQKKIGPN